MTDSYDQNRPGTSAPGQGYGTPQPQGSGHGTPGSGYDTQATPYGTPAGTQGQAYGVQGTGYGHPAGQSDKSRVAAGLLQLLLGGVAAGRWYLGWTKIALAQLLLNVLGVLLMFGGVLGAAFSSDPATGTPSAGTTGFLLLAPFGWALCAAVGIWVLVDAIRMFLGKVPDAQGRPLG